MFDLGHFLSPYVVVGGNGYTTTLCAGTTPSTMAPPKGPLECLESNTKAFNFHKSVFLQECGRKTQKRSGNASCQQPEATVRSRIKVVVPRQHLINAFLTGVLWSLTDQGTSRTVTNAPYQ